MWLWRRGAAGLLDEELYGDGIIAEVLPEDGPRAREALLRTVGMSDAMTDQTTGQWEQEG